MEYLLMPALAVVLDLALGDPPDAFHPVAWMGKAISLLERGSPSRHHAAQLVYGIAIVVVITVLFTAPAYFLLAYLKGVNFIIYVVAGAILLKATFSITGLRRAALKIERLLMAEKLEEARFELRALVSRDTSGLPGPLLVSAAVESVAESAGDSLVAPLFWFLLLGMPGAIAYRVVNTCDAMIGYHSDRYEYLGKFAARLDDVLSFVPARLAALLLVLAAFIMRRDARSSWHTALSDHAHTASPNAGWPMAAAAGALGVQLEKVGHYCLGKPGTPLVPETIGAALGLSYRAMLAWVLVCLIIGGARFAVTA